MGALVAQSCPSISAFPETTVVSACTSSFSRIARRSLTLRPAHSPGHQTRDRYPKASDISSPPCLLRLLPAGAVAGRDLHPLEKRRLVTAHAEKQTLLPGIAAGETTATLAWVEDNGRWDAEGTALTTTAEGGATVLSGHKVYVVDGHTADLIVVLARAPQGLSLFTVDGNAPGLNRRALKSLDPTRKFARLELDGVAATALGPVGGATAPFARTMVEAAVCLANEMVGGADRLREDALAEVDAVLGRHGAVTVPPGWLED
jgi:alkylation response protein AidB-like acyl-CoA dehydrogenase